MVTEMIVNHALQRDPQQRLMIESSRVSLYLIILMVTLVSYFFSNQFINWTVLAPFYGLIFVALMIHLIIVSFLDSMFLNARLILATFLLDSVLISALIYFSGTNQSLFLFLHLINILLAGLVLRTQGALVVALTTSTLFTFVCILGPDMKAMSFFFLLALNNVAYFLIAGLSGYLSEQLYEVDTRLIETGLTLKQTQQLNQFVLAHMPLGLVTFEKDGALVQANPSARQIFNQTANSENVFTLFPEIKAMIDASGGVQKAEIAKTLAGEDKVLGVTLSRTLNPLTNENLWIGLFEDLTHLKKMEMNLRQSEKMAAVGGLAAGIAHEIRNPLAGISGSVELLSQTTQSEDDRKLMRIILREIDRLNHLITEFLDYARPDQLPTDIIDLAPLLREILDSMKLNQKVRQDVSLNIEIADSILVQAKKDKLKQAFLNIIINSFQALQEVLTPQLSVHAVPLNDGRVVVKIKDTGVGMKPETLKRMFEPFHTTKPKGTGLGLAITHKILESHRVEVSCQSTLGQGTEFTLIFPCPPGRSSEK